MLVGAAFVGAAVAAVGIALLLAITSLHRTAGEARHSERVIGQANLVEKLLLDLETGERGYVITGQQQFLEPFRDARVRLDPEARELRRLVKDDPDQRPRAVAIEREATAYLRDWAIPLVDTATHSLPRSRARVATGGGKRRVDEIRPRFRTLVRAEELDTRARGAHADVAAFRAIAIAIAAGGFAFAEQAIPGTGLGLTIVKALVEAHGGRISVESVEGSGTTFRIDLPSQDSSEARA
jgi:CHASE3 domain sensor protein